MLFKDTYFKAIVPATETFMTLLMVFSPIGLVSVSFATEVEKTDHRMFF